MARDLKYFMRERKAETVIVTMPERFVDDDGNRVELEIRKLSKKEIDKINDAYRWRRLATDKRGNPLISNGTVVHDEGRDTTKTLRHIIAEALVYPNLKDPELMEWYNCRDITEMPNEVFSDPDEFTEVQRLVLTTLGLIEGGEVELDELVDDAKN
jgi:hypothetical protein